MRKQASTNAENETAHVARCPLAAALVLVGGRWKPMLLWYVAHGLDRYGKLRKAIPGMSEKMLYQQLRELEHDGLLVRSVEGRNVRYRTGDLVATLLPILAALEAWSIANDAGALVLRRRARLTSEGSRTVVSLRRAG